MKETFHLTPTKIKNTSFVVRTTSNIPCHSIDLRCWTSAAQIVSLNVYEPEYACHL